MTRREVEAICRVFKRVENCEGPDMREYLGNALCNALAELNSGFNKEKFRKHAGLSATNERNK
jgi:hypothetical protein